MRPQSAPTSPTGKQQQNDINIMPHDRPWYCTTKSTCRPAGYGWSHHCDLYTQRA